MRWLVSALAYALIYFTAQRAFADRELIVPFHETGHLVLDQLSGVKVNGDGASYAGPVGASYQREKVDGVAESKLTTLWVAPSFDYFVADHLSLGGTFEVAHSFGSVTVGTTVTESKETKLEAIPRIGFYAPFGDRLGVWPRVGLGYLKSDALESIVLEVDVALVYRFTEAFFVRLGPEVGVTLGGRRSDGADAQVLSISGVIGLGMNLEL